MSDFKKSLEKTLINEGGYVNDKDDSGGETYKGIARNMHPKWQGWQCVDSYKNNSLFPSILDRNNELQRLVELFYKYEFWDKMRLDGIISQNVSDAIFDFGVNAGIGTSIRLAQLSVNVFSDGVIGENTLSAINSKAEADFLSDFAVVKIIRYMTICKQKPVSRKYLYGWIKRTLNL